MIDEEGLKKLIKVINEKKHLRLNALSQIEEAMEKTTKAIEYSQEADSDTNLIDSCKEIARAGVIIAVEELAATLKEAGY